MLRQLLESYLSHWPFAVVHAALLGWALYSYFSGRGQIQRHRRDLTSGPDLKRLATSTDPWAALERLKVDKVPFSEVREQYHALLASYVDELAGLANLLVLTGVVGTLYGLYSGFAQAPVAVGAPDGTLTSSLAGAFGAFGVTIAAVALAAVVLVLQRQMARRCDEDQISIAEVWQSSGPVARAPLEVEMDQVKALVAQFQPVVARMEQHSDRILNDSATLDRIVTSFAAMKETVDALPGSLRASLDESRGAYLLGMREVVSSWREHHDVSLHNAAQLAASAKAAHELYMAELGLVRDESRALFAQVKEDNQRAFLDLRMTFDNLAKQVSAVDRSSEEILTTFSERVSAVLAKNVALLDSRLTTMLDAAPGVERGLQLIAPTAAAAAQQVESVQAAATSAVALMQDVCRDLTTSLAALRSHIDAFPGSERLAAASSPPPLTPPSAAAPLPALAAVAPAAEAPAAPAIPRATFLAVALTSAIAGGLVTELMRWA